MVNIVDHLKSYVKMGIIIPDYIKDLINKNNLNLSTYQLGLDYLNSDNIIVAEKVLSLVDVSLSN